MMSEEIVCPTCGHDVTALQEQIQTLREMLEDAYREGYADGFDDLNDDFLEESWNDSMAKQELEGAEQ
jgi:hypothetical protein